MNAAVDGVLTLAMAMCASVKTIGASGVNPGSAQQNSPLLDDRNHFFVSFFLKKKILDIG
ncbi:hypothetical protein [Aquirufa rosea]|uniref:Uncharacterized protein n=1 Tax=Aquirufa rosea TaxID=2509241 RepID=A0A4Q1BXE6_9BACT|nr:hypothetical protein [Aquirufa rosea]RXK47070.1 hypothetical protein ESB04_10740 [Aquirufa rosea]